MKRLRICRKKPLVLPRFDAQTASFAETAAGQEVARWFFHVGGTEAH
jgi:hypothetical protein